jgi:hypothetical protein
MYRIGDKVATIGSEWEIVDSTEWLTLTCLRCGAVKTLRRASLVPARRDVNLRCKCNPTLPRGKAVPALIKTTTSDEPEYSWEEIGIKLGTTPEEAERVYERALRKMLNYVLSNPHIAKEMGDYFSVQTKLLAETHSALVE